MLLSFDYDFSPKLNLFSSSCRTGSAEPCLFLPCVLFPIFHVSLR